MQNYNNGVEVSNYTNKLPAHYEAIFYTNDPETGYYTPTEKQPGKSPVMHLPRMLKVETTPAHQVHEIKFNGSVKLFTNLRPTVFLFWFTGTYKKKLCLFRFTVNDSGLIIYFFPRYADKPAARQRFVIDTIPLLLSNTSCKYNV